jgi:hypothetical protein
MNKPYDSRRELVKTELVRFMHKLEGPVEVDFAIDWLQAHRKELARTAAVATETRARVFLNQRWTVFGSQFQGPWPVEFVTPLDVTYVREGLNMATSLTFRDRFEAQVTNARFVRLGRLNLARYVVLEVPAAAIIKTQRERAEYGLKATDQLEVHATMYRMIQCQPQWVLDRLSKIRIARLRAIAANTGAAP